MLLYCRHSYGDVGSISNLGEARHFEETLFRKKKEAVSKNEKSTSLFIVKSWGHMPPVPPPLGSYVSAFISCGFLKGCFVYSQKL